MMTPSDETPKTRRAQHRQASADSRADRERSLDAMHALEASAGRAGPGRYVTWRAAVIEAISQLEAALAEQRASYEDPASLMAQIAQDEPRLRTLVRQVHHRWIDLAATAQTLRETLESADTVDAGTIADTREQLRWMMTALHHHRARESDLVFEAFGIDLAQ